MNRTEIIRLLTTRYASSIYKPMKRAVQDFQLITPGDHIAVCISGGKDSMLLALLLDAFRAQLGISLTFLAMDPGYTPQGRAHIEENAAQLGLSLAFFDTNVLRVAENHAETHPCFLCAKMRRGYLYQEAQARGCNKIALGHHYDDVIETTLMSLLYGGQAQTMLPRLAAKNYYGMELIRPLYYVREQAVTDWMHDAGMTFLSCDCPAKKETAKTTRADVKALIARLAQDNPQVEKNIFHAMQCVDTTKILGWKDAAGTHRFLDAFAEGEEKQQP